MVQTSHPYMTTENTMTLTIWTFVTKVTSLLFNMLSSFIIAFLPRSESLLISWLQSPSAVILEPKKIKSVMQGMKQKKKKKNKWQLIIWKWDMTTDTERHPYRFLMRCEFSMGILQTKILEWVAMPSSKGSSQPRNWTQVFSIAGRFFTIWSTKETPREMWRNGNFTHSSQECNWYLHFVKYPAWLTIES